jgi:hypothetical protein
MPFQSVRRSPRCLRGTGMTLPWVKGMSAVTQALETSVRVVRGCVPPYCYDCSCSGVLALGSLIGLTSLSNVSGCPPLPHPHALPQTCTSCPVGQDRMDILTVEMVPLAVLVIVVRMRRQGRWW